MRCFRMIFALIAASAAVPLTFAASNSADVAHLHVQLVFPNQNLNRGTPANAGLYFKLESGWHVYWKNAGDSGEPPHIQWSLPAGITASAIEFPAPQRLPLGPLMDFGYENEVLFPFTVKAAATAKPGSVVLHAKVDWLVCREVCIPGKAELDQNVNVISRAPAVNLISPSDQELWNRLTNALPKALPSGDTTVFQPTPTGFRLAVTTDQRETQAEFFPEDEDILDNPAPQTVTPTATGLDSRPEEGREPHYEPGAAERRARTLGRQELRDCRDRPELSPLRPLHLLSHCLETPPSRPLRLLSPSPRSPARRSSLSSAACCST